MPLHRFFLRAELGRQPAHTPVEREIPLETRDVRHIVDVLRLAPGDGIVVVEPAGSAWEVRLTRTARTGCAGTVVHSIEPQLMPRVSLVTGLVTGGKSDLAIEKVVEIGVESVYPVLTERSLVRLSPTKAASRGERWRRVARAAAQQSQRAFVPVVADPVRLDSLIGTLAGEFDVVLVAWEEASASAPRIGEVLRTAHATRSSRIAVVTGAEAGLSGEEVSALTSVGAVTVSLGPTVLRAETAAIIAPALVLYELGGLGGRPRG